MKNVITYSLCLLIAFSMSTSTFVIAQQYNFVNQENLNTSYSEDNPILSADGQLIFFNSTRNYESRIWAKYKNIEGRFDYDIYFAEKKDGDWQDPVNLGTYINSGEDDVVVSISPDGNIIYYLSFKAGWRENDGPFYKAELHGSQWKNVKGLAGGINIFFNTNQDAIYVSGASMSPDGKEFYFSTNIGQLHGTFDIWVSTLKNGIWQYPVNLGPIINAKNSYNTAPYMAYNDRTLYFSSDGFGGYGNKEIFFSILRDDGWSLPLNVGDCINSIATENQITIPASGDIVYMVSDRPEGKGNSDIYTAELSHEVRPSSVVLVSGHVSDTSNNPIEADITLEDLVRSVKVYSTWSNLITGKYTVIMKPGSDYRLNFKKDGYLFSSAKYNIPYSTEFKEIKKNHSLKPLKDGIKYVSYSILFEYDKATLFENSKPELDTIVTILENNKSLLLEISGFTDNIGSEKYNQWLSEKRANSVKNYIIRIGNINPDRIEAIGFGENYPIGDNNTEEGRQKNRRTEFKFKQL
ncbi:OmpA family protein [Bacteroidota bacterium]